MNTNSLDGQLSFYFVKEYNSYHHLLLPFVSLTRLGIDPGICVLRASCLKRGE